LLSRRAARKHLVASRLPKYFLRLHSAGSVSPGSGRPVRRELGYGPAVRLKPFRPHLTVGALSCAIRSQRGRHAPTARALKAAGAHPGGFPHRRPSPTPIEPHSHPVLNLPIFLRPTRHYPRLWLRTPLGSVRLDFHQLATRPARRALRSGPPMCPASLLSPSQICCLGFSLQTTSRRPEPLHWPAVPSGRQVPEFRTRAQTTLAPPFMPDTHLASQQAPARLVPGQRLDPGVDGHRCW
jgi:hypothetical protein